MASNRRWYVGITLVILGLLTLGALATLAWGVFGFVFWLSIMWVLFGFGMASK